MRALCGAIITAGALIGLDMATLGVGIRYAGYTHYDSESHTFADLWVHFLKMDTALVMIIVVLLITLVIGLVTAFLGLAYHHKPGSANISLRPGSFRIIGSRRRTSLRLEWIGAKRGASAGGARFRPPTRAAHPTCLLTSCLPQPLKSPCHRHPERPRD